MFREKITKYLFDHPRYLNLVKSIVSSRLIANSSLYKIYALKRARERDQKFLPTIKPVFIETTLNCNSRCIFCYHNKKVMTGTMDMILFRKIIDESKDLGISSVILSVYGEPTVDKFFWERVDYLVRRELDFGFITNAFLFDEKMTDKLIKIKRFTYVQFSVSGFSKEVYERVMVGLKKDITYKNINYFLKQKQKHKRNDLVVNMSYVLNKYNEIEFKEYFQYWSGKKGVTTVMPVELIDRMGENYNGEIGQLGPMQKKGNWLSPCGQLWDQIVVYYDGKVGPCCDDNDLRKLIVGDLNKERLEDVFKGSKLRALRQLHINNKRCNHPVCGGCYHNTIWLR